MIRKVLLITLFISRILLCIAYPLEREPRLDQMQSFTYNSGWHQDGYTEYFYNPDDEIDYYNTYTGDTGNYTLSQQSEYTYTSGQISELITRQNTGNSLINQSRTVYTYNNYGYDNLYSYTWSNGNWLLNMQTEYLWSNASNYRRNYYSITNGTSEMSMYQLVNYNADEAMSEVITYSNIPYYGGWVVTSRMEYSYFEGNTSVVATYATDFVNEGEYLYMQGNYDYNNSGDLSEIIYRVYDSGSNQLVLWSRYLYLYEEVENEENLQVSIPEMEIYPNPCRNGFTVKSGKNLSLYDLRGRRIAAFPSNNADIKVNTTTLASGIYFMKADDDSLPPRKVVILK